MAAHVDAEVCVVGGGPAGATLACRLAALGHEVVVVERRPFPRPHIGESVSPGVWPLLELLGARERVEAGFPAAVEARVRWGGAEERRRTSLDGGEPPLTVDRGAFDAILLERARSAGARVLQPAAARCVAPAPGGGCKIELADADGAPSAVRARFVADASGRRRFAGGGRRRTSVRTHALHARWWGVDGTATRVDAAPAAWYWGAHLPDGSFRAMAFVDSDLIRARHAEGVPLERAYRDLLAASPLFADLAAGRAGLADRVATCDATCYAALDPIDATNVRVGEAAFAIDPLSSSGVQTAMQTGVAAAAVVRSILTDGDAEVAARYYRDHQAHAVEHHARLAARAYADCAAHRDEPFWRLRADRPPRNDGAATGARADLRDLLPRPVRLSRGATLEPTPCVVGDRVELRRALAHPALERPVAYLAGNELAPLLDGLGEGAPFERVVAGWTRAVPSAAAYAVADWLARNGLLEPAA